VTDQLQPAIDVRDLTKRYAGRAVVDDLSFEVRRGEVFSLLGPNGAGKTTTIEILEGYRRADGGSVSVLGVDPIREAAALKPRIGVMLQEGGLYPAITPLEALQLFARYYPRARHPEELIELVDLGEARDTRYRRLSSGQKQRLSLALALVGRPDLVFLDEPTAGLDPRARRATWDVIRGLKESNTTVLLSTHYLEEAERLADRVAIIRDGRLLALGSPAELTQSDRSTVRLRAAVTVDVQDLAGAGLPALEIHADADDSLIFSTDDAPALLVALTTVFRDRGIPIVELRTGAGSLEDVFLEMTGDVA
jgi:ABC-2 type transport system ATP-binding protein